MRFSYNLLTTIYNLVIIYLMTIAGVREKCKSTLAKVPRDVLMVAVILTAAVLSFGCGFFAGKEAGQGSAVSIQTPLSPIPMAEVADGAPAPESSGVVASKNGTKYYLPTCSGANRISEANKVWFASAAAARAQGYSAAENCKGIE